MNEKMKNNRLSLILSVLSFVGVLILFCLYFCCNKQCCTINSSDSAITPVFTSETSSEWRIAYIDTDSIFSKYMLAQESKKSVENLYKSKERQLQTAQSQLEADYNAYIQTGASLTLQQQQDKEAELTQRGMRLRQMEEQFMTEVDKMSQEKNKITTDSVLNFINRYNAKHQYTLILDKVVVLHRESAFDITQDVLTGLNAEYEATKGKK